MASSILNSDDGVISGTSGLKSTGGDDGVLNIQNNGTTAVTVNASRNVGVGVTPSPWSTGKAVEVGGNGSSLWGLSSGTKYNTAGYYFNATDKFAITGNYAVFSQLVPSDGSFRWRSSTATGTAGNDATMADRMILTQSGNLQFNSGYGSVATAYGCRAWVKFDGGGAIGGSGNVSSVSDTATGQYEVNLSTAMPDTNYGWAITSEGGATTIICGAIDVAVSRTTSKLPVTTRRIDTNALIDVADNSAVIFR
jgi:hypothetical protein